MAQAATANLSVIVISYHVSDEYWGDQLESRLKQLPGDFALWIDRVDVEIGSQIDYRSQVRLIDAKVLVVLISQAYLNKTWLGNEEERRAWMSSWGATKVLGVIVGEITREQLLALPSDCKLVNSNPLAKSSIESANLVITQVVNEIGILTSPDKNIWRHIEDLPKSRSSEVENALHHARKLATLYPTTPPAVSTPALLFGLAERGRLESDHFRTPQFLWKELTARGEEMYSRALMEEFPELTRLGERKGGKIDSLAADVDHVTPFVIEVFELAEDLARYTAAQTSPRTSKAQQTRSDLSKHEIAAHHLLAALLVYEPKGGRSTVANRLQMMVPDVAALRRRFYNFIVKNLPDDNHEAWRPILINLKVPPIQPKLPPQKDSKPSEPFVQPSVAGFMADEWAGQDLLGITRDVNALASLVAAYSVEPPLSIGLFGDWGSGKSHFMRQMRKQVEKLSELARNSGEPQNKLGYYKNIVQIEFNAWHYIEGNLWASLVDHIFANLKLSEREPPKFAEQRRDELMQKLGLKEELAKKINSQVEACETELRKVQERKEQAEKELDKASTQLEDFRQHAVASLETLSVAVDLTAEEKELLGRLGIDADGVINGAEVRKNYDELKGIRNRIKAQWKLFLSDKRAGRRYVLSALMGLILVGGPVLFKFAPSFRGNTAIVGIIAFIATFIAAAKPAWEQFRKSWKALEKQDQEIERQRSKRITELRSEVNALGREIAAAKLESETVGKDIEELKSDIANTSSSRLLAEFIEDRAAANDYRRHLGLLALIRRDFEKLRDLFDQQRQEEIAGTDATNKNRINRIILYIDDLDRCPPDRVVQVLQAIHLLLAFPLFVVVVGVDSRWVTRSLQQSYEWLREGPDDADEDGKQAENQDGKPYGGIGATPHDYLEKIFQIPFWLRSMSDDACVEFIDGLTRQAVHQGSAQAIAKLDREKGTIEVREQLPAVENRPLTYRVTSTVPEDMTPLQGIYSKQEPVESAQKARPDQKPDLMPRSLTFSSHEVEYMKTLVPLIGRSPRAVKRFLNCYRLIKVRLTPAEFENFVGEKGESPSYKAVMILLGVITGAPTVSSFVIDELKLWRGAKEFKLETFKTALVAKPELLKQPDAERLIRFFNMHDFGKPSDAVFKEIVSYSPQASRFSFRVDRVDTPGHRHSTVALDRALSARPPRKRVSQN